LGETRPPGDLADTQAYATGVELPDTVEGLGSGRGPYELLSIGAGRTQVILSEETVQREQSADNTNCRRTPGSVHRSSDTTVLGSPHVAAALAYVRC
jgi:hypothetical protein